MNFPEDSSPARPASFLSRFKIWRNTNNILLRKKHRCISSEIKTLQETLKQEQGNREKLHKRLEYLKQELQNLPKGKSALFFSYAFILLISVSLLNIFFDQLSTSVDINWNNNPDYLLRFRTSSVLIWQLYKTLEENLLIYPVTLIWLFIVYSLQKHMLWFHAKYLIWASLIISFGFLLLLMLSYSHLSFRPLL
jgi:hypothetical protein